MAKVFIISPSKLKILKAAIEELKAAGVRMIDEKPREGAHGARIAFIHPKSTHGVLIELCQHASGH